MPHWKTHGDIRRELLRRIPRVENVETGRNRHNAWCCGAGAGVKSAFSTLALFASLERLKEAREVAPTLVSACPFCKRNFNDANEEYGMGLEIMDLVELVDLAMS